MLGHLREKFVTQFCCQSIPIGIEIPDSKIRGDYTLPNLSLDKLGHKPFIEKG